MITLQKSIEECRTAMTGRWASQAELLAAERLDRWTAARPVLEQLPAFCRVPVAALRERTGPAFLRGIGGWSWDSGSLVLVGPTGSGKTSAAALLVRRLVADGIRDGGEAWQLAERVVWMHVRDLTSDVREHPLGRGEVPELAHAKRASLLVFDDIGWEHDARVIGEVLEARYRDGLPVVLTTGMHIEKLDERLGEAVMRRANESGGRRATLVEAWS